MARCFGEPDTTSPADFELALDRCLDYCDWIGFNTISYPVYWYNTPIYDSKELSINKVYNLLVCLGRMM